MTHSVFNRPATYRAIPDLDPVPRRPLVRAIVALCHCGLAIALAVAGSVASAQVLVVLTRDADVYRQVAEELKARLAPLRDGHLKIDVASPADLAAFDDRRYASYELVVTIGLAAAQGLVPRAAGHATLPPTLCVLVPHQGFDAMTKVAVAERERRVSAVFIEQPLERQLDLISLAFPKKTRIGVIFGPESVALAPDVEARARERGLALNRADISDSRGIYGALQKALRDSDLLLALPDPVAINASTMRGVLLTSYQAQVPVFGFSQALVDAGALLAVYSTARQHGRQAAEIVTHVLEGGGLPLPQYPRYFTVGVNFIAARSLGLMMDDEATLAAELAQRSRASRETGERARPGVRTDAAPRKAP